MFSIYFPNFEKLKSFVETLTPYNQILILEEQLCKCISNMDFYIDTDQTRISGAAHATVPLKLNFMMFAVEKSMKIKIEGRGLILKRRRGYSDRQSLENLTETRITYLISR
jgi:hypothetical protein